MRVSVCVTVLCRLCRLFVCLCVTVCAVASKHDHIHESRCKLVFVDFGHVFVVVGHPLCGCRAGWLRAYQFWLHDA